MVATTSAAVSGKKGILGIGPALWHVIGLIFGASVLALLLSTLGQALRLPTLPFSALIGIVALLWGASSFLGRPLPVYSSNAQVPIAWSHTMSRDQYAFSYGVGLGLGVFTRIPSLSFQALMGVMLLTSNPLLALAIAQTYALARGAPVLAASLANLPAERLVARMAKWRGAAFRADAVALFAVGVALASRAAGAA
jgi:hypothetical protein